MFWFFKEVHFGKIFSLTTLFYCVKQIGANINLAWSWFLFFFYLFLFFFPQNWLKKLHWETATAFLEQSGCFRQFNTKHIIYPQFSSSIACCQWLKIKASIVTEPLHESWKAGSAANELEILSKERITEANCTQKFSHS